MDWVGTAIPIPLVFSLASDPLLAKILPSKALINSAFKLAIKHLPEDESPNKEAVPLQLLNAAIEGDLITVVKVLKNNPEVVDTTFAGVTPLIYAICFRKQDIIESLVATFSADPDLHDTIFQYTPLMWAVYLDQIETVKLLLDYQADPYLSPKDEKNAVSLVIPDNVEMYEFFKLHNLTNKATTKDDFYNSFNEESFDDLDAKLKLATISTDVEEEKDTFYEEDDEYLLSQDQLLNQLEEFDYEKLLPEQYIKFKDSDIPSLLDFTFSLRAKQYQHDAKVPAAVIFQLLRYSSQKVNSDELTEFLFDSFTTRLRSVTNTLSGAFNMAIQDGTSSGSSGDIVLISYWLAVLQFLHFYLSKGGLYTAHPKFQHELANLLKSLIAALSFSINSRLTDLVDQCLLDFTSLLDVSNVMYAKDWNLFKKDKTPNTYDDILDMLYPPSQNELMKPSPIRYLQVLGALEYVLNIHKVNLLIKSQTYSQVFYYIDCIIFNRILSQSRYCARTKAVQIRLNISAIEDWLRGHNFKVTLPDQRLDSLYKIGKLRLQPTVELLQFLQCVSVLPDQENLINTINQFEYLNYFQLFKIVNKLYRYEVGEPKIPKKSVQLLRSLVNERGTLQLDSIPLTYLTHSGFLSKEEFIFLNPNQIFDAEFSSLSSMINEYGVGFGGVRILRAKKYQPSLPISVIDEVDEILSLNRESNMNDTYDYEKENEVDSEETNDVKADVIKEKVDFKGDQLFKTVQLPNSLAHKHWGETEFEENPW